jgi:N-acetylglucosaminyl-diphospho-decaprenol L-rhamnosyltransferase
MVDVDVVIVSYNSRDKLRACVGPLAELDNVRVIVVDNASSDGSLDAISDLRVEAIALETNGGFAHGCNHGLRAGDARYVLFLNPDAVIEAPALATMIAELDREPGIGAVAPRIVHDDGSIDYSVRRFPRLRSTYAQALFLHRLFPKATWTDEVIRDADSYARRGSPDWVSGACILARRSLLEELGGFDEGFFMYCEDIDLCRQIRDAGYDIVFEPSAEVVHEGGASAPRASMLPILAASRLRYATKHRGKIGATLERLGIALSALTHILVSRGGVSMRAGHSRALRLAIFPTAGES